ncbi:hypothetical protein L195_g058473, partial [Trifolium pratense]
YLPFIPRNAFRPHEYLAFHYHTMFGSTHKIHRTLLRLRSGQLRTSLKKCLLPTIIGILDSSTSSTILLQPPDCAFSVLLKNRLPSTIHAVPQAATSNSPCIQLPPVVPQVTKSDHRSFQLPP